MNGVGDSGNSKAHPKAMLEFFKAAVLKPGVYMTDFFHAIITYFPYSVRKYELKLSYLCVFSPVITLNSYRIFIKLNTVPA